MTPFEHRRQYARAKMHALQFLYDGEHDNYIAYIRYVSALKRLR